MSFLVFWKLEVVKNKKLESDGNFYFVLVGRERGSNNLPRADEQPVVTERRSFAGASEKKN